MTMESKVVSLESYRARKLVSLLNSSAFLLGCELDEDSNMTFAHVLNIPASEEVWPGDAAELFFPELFALRLSDDWLYVLNDLISEHMRCETLRLCNSIFFDGLKYYEHDLDRYMNGVSFPPIMFGDDGDDEDTLNSELLLTQIYEPPRGR